MKRKRNDVLIHGEKHLLRDAEDLIEARNLLATFWRSYPHEKRFKQQLESMLMVMSWMAHDDKGSKPFRELLEGIRQIREEQVAENTAPSVTDGNDYHA